MSKMKEELQKKVESVQFNLGLWHNFSVEAAEDWTNRHMPYIHQYLNAGVSTKDLADMLAYKKIMSRSNL